ncbi:hypothetical protein VD0002_g2001 [Verticillium dahliae]|uniref:SMB domain-containing protein n=2 Tax=Verticillium TaxID=1036719 RepID=A0A0G4MZC8_VERLO|nr:hypothetical protein BJF96_g5377 [Verticillium dahliae]CRK39484.1 hypothetical protein BN1708_001688 [Verticillium longisporum]PNH42960.1 hypothetical protein VD0004_g4450 [Verticillium dahliae]PNH54297.1 hypothetical protein VD0003_g3229 [Verticillium dahliae]PNH67869.1 hypothetical protein VD0002_g2001 [Verticillium dahliae]
MQISIIILTTLAGICLGTPGLKARDIRELQGRQTCAIPNLGCYNNGDCCGGLSCDFSESCCLPDFDDSEFGKRQNCGCCRK